jgi:chromosome partition protein MukE
MSLTNIEQVMPVKLAQALANPLFPALDSALRSGRISAWTSWIITPF